MKHQRFTHSLSVLTALAALLCAVAPSQAADKKPNILFIMFDEFERVELLVERCHFCDC